MEKIALITDTGGDLSLTELKENNIFLTPFIIRYGNKEFKDVLEISSREIYNRLHEEIPTSSLPDLSEVTDLLNNLVSKGYTHAIIVTISSGLSGTFNSLRLLCEDFEGLETFVYDSKALTVIEGQLVLKISNMIRDGKSFDKIVEEIPKIRERMHGYFTIDTLEYLQKGGRIGKMESSLGSILQIKPIASVNKEGVLYTHSKVRGKKKALKKMTSYLEEVLSKYKCNVWVLEGGAEEEALNYMNVLKEENYENMESLNFGHLGPIFGMNTGPGLVAIVYEKIAE
ncbi:DegV family protein [Clostridium sp. LIBA-8841]|uniref:DegV family protein n=1 Tax=Clostridium sp. LIBA-8841 TaxID=2987530 RepID=UPI002AC6F90B|nr:DegV family protein [Clostridium sp. LIBA-8841]MDZ5252502.1 DegV family protein [Clostridium sp. LIBA-8841]